MAQDMVTLKFISGIADSGSLCFNAGDIAELPRAIAKDYLGMKIAVEIGPNTCPHCGGQLEPQTPPGLEAATVGHAPRRRG